MHTRTWSRAQESLLPCLCVTLLSSFVTVSCVRFSSFILFFSVCLFTIVLYMSTVAIAYPLPNMHISLSQISKAKRERQKWVHPFSWSPVFLIILSALSCLVLPPPVKSAFYLCNKDKRLQWCKSFLPRSLHVVVWSFTLINPEMVLKPLFDFENSDCESNINC